MFHKKEKILLIGSNLWFLGEGMLGPLFAIFGQRVGGDIMDLSWAYALYFITVGLLVIFIGKVSDKLSKEKFLVLGYLLNTLFTFSYLMVSSTLHLFLVQIGLGISAALTIPTWYSLYAKYEDKKHGGVTWGLVAGNDRIMMGIAMMVGGVIVTYFSFNALFITMGLVQCVATYFIAKILKNN